MDFVPARDEPFGDKLGPARDPAVIIGGPALADQRDPPPRRRRKAHKRPPRAGCHRGEVSVRPGAARHRQPLSIGKAAHQIFVKRVMVRRIDHPVAFEPRVDRQQVTPKDIERFARRDKIGCTAMARDEIAARHRRRIERARNAIARPDVAGRKLMPYERVGSK